MEKIKIIKDCKTRFCFFRNFLKLLASALLFSFGLFQKKGQHILSELANRVTKKTFWTSLFFARALSKFLLAPSQLANRLNRRYSKSLPACVSRIKQRRVSGKVHGYDVTNNYFQKQIWFTVFARLCQVKNPIQEGSDSRKGPNLRDRLKILIELLCYLSIFK